MATVNLKQARERLGDLVSAAERGETTLITRRGKKAARIVPVDTAKRRGSPGLPNLAKFRASIRVKGPSLSKTLIRARKRERY
jgi:prevent-host-death family protein